MALTLQAFLKASAQGGFVYGVHDCLLWLADWAVANGWPDPASSWRGRYTTALGCRRLLNREGGLIRIAIKGCASVGLPRVANLTQLRPGDLVVGRSLVAAAGSGWDDDEPCGMLRTPIGLAALTKHGVVVGPGYARAAWRVERA
jgi:hypothetical protein